MSDPRPAVATGPFPFRPLLPWLKRQLEGGPLHFTLLDPDKTPGRRAGEMAHRAEELGTHLVLLGGSTGIRPEGMSEAARSIHASTRVPVVIFPQGAESVTPEADGILWMSLLNSRSLRWVIRTHAATSLAIRRLGLEPISLGYLVVAPGMKVGEVGEADVLPRDRPEVAAGWALAAEYLGMQLVYLEAGSGAPEPVPPVLVRAVREVLSVPLLVGGGIRRADQARSLLDAGARILVTGTVVEEGGEEGLRPIIEEVNRHRVRPHR
jgi:phosphoglycerol geranylgeranyltransferase